MALRAVFLALILAGLSGGCRAYNSNNPYPSSKAASGGSYDFPITKEIINNNVERGSPNL